MEKYNWKVKTFEDIQREFPDVTEEKYKDLLTNVEVKKLIKREIIRLEGKKEWDIWLDEFTERKLTANEKAKIKEIAEPAAVYWFKWAQNHIDDQLLGAFQWWLPGNRKILFRRMHKNGLDEYDREKDAIYEFFQSIEGGGRVKKIIRGKTFVMFDPYAPKDASVPDYSEDAKFSDDDFED